MGRLAPPSPERPFTPLVPPMKELSTQMHFHTASCGSNSARCEVISQRHRVLHMKIDDEYNDNVWKKTSVDCLESSTGT